MKIEPSDQARVSAAIQAAEQKTSAEIVCVLARASSDYAAMPLVWSIIVALLVPWALFLFSHWAVERILLAQLAALLIAMLTLSMPAIRVGLTPRRIQRAHAFQAAAEQFLTRGLTRAKARSGVLIFVSVAERYARIIVDERVAENVAEKDWQAVVNGLTAAMAEDRAGDGFVAAIGACADILARHLPPEPGQANALPDRLFVI